MEESYYFSKKGFFYLLEMKFNLLKNKILKNGIRNSNSEKNSLFLKNLESILQNSEDDSYISNTHKDKAIVMLSCIFRNSSTIHLFSNNKKPNVSNDIKYELAVRNLLYRGGKVFLIVNNKIDFNNAFRVYRLLYIYSVEKPDLVKIGIADDTFKKEVQKLFNNKIINFCVSDNDFIRIEHNTEKYNAGGYRNHEERMRLSQLVEECIERSPLIQITNKDEVMAF